MPESDSILCCFHRRCEQRRIINTIWGLPVDKSVKKETISGKVIDRKRAVHEVKNALLF